jgi:hypothetical protein
VDTESHEVIISDLTSTTGGDAETGAKMLRKIPKIKGNVYGDGAYDSLEFRQQIEEIGAEPIIPPPRNAKLHPSNDPAQQKRDKALYEIMGLGGMQNGRKLWKKLVGYHKRSLVETAMYRFKQSFGNHLVSREWERQRTEILVKCLIINKMTELGMPDSQWRIAA